GRESDCFKLLGGLGFEIVPKVDGHGGGSPQHGMLRPPPELVAAFFDWYRAGDRPQSEDAYKGTITQQYLSSLSDSEFVDFFFRFGKEGGQIQSGGERTASQFKAAIEANLPAFRAFALEPFQEQLDEIAWLERTQNFFGFGRGISTIYLN